jgi:hypothetical protein
MAASQAAVLGVGPDKLASDVSRVNRAADLVALARRDVDP